MLKQVFGLSVAAALLLTTGNTGLADAPDQELSQARYWVFFTDKGIAPALMPHALAAAEQGMTERSRLRRMKSRPAIADYYDLPLCAEYVAATGAAGAALRSASRWLNAVSVTANAEQIAALQALPFVRRVQPFRARRLQTDLAPLSFHHSLDDPDYGPSLRQDSICGIPELHSRGLSGRGVLMCFLDTGYRLSHNAFDSLNVVGTRDFIFNDDNVGNESGQDSASQDWHGTVVLSAAAGYADGILIGPAFGADILCAKTEWVASETPIEEDYYVAALEWADSLGADIVSSSLGYLDWYEFADLDGQTAVTTVGVNIAVSRGILVTTAAGNERGSDWNHIIAPADADSILAIGAVDTTLAIAAFSSPGPTADGRIKPDVCALGTYVVSADPTRDDRYVLTGGTSLATPLVAGVAALVMEAHPDWTAQQVRAALLATASRANAPDNDYGWGIVNGPAAVDYDVSVAPGRGAHPESAVLLSAYPNPVNGQVVLTVRLPAGGAGSLQIFDVLGRSARALPRRTWNAGTHSVPLSLDGLPTGVYFARYAGTQGVALRKVLLVR